MGLGRVGKIAGWVVVAALSLEGLYLVLMNGILFSGLIERAASTNDGRVDVAFSWRRAWSPWPGRAYVRDFRLQLEDPALQFRLDIAEAAFDVAPLDLLHKQFTASHVRAAGVRFELAPKVEKVGGLEERLAGFPFLEGFARPALLAQPPLPELTADERALLWTVHLDDVEADVDELWALEFRYRGSAHVSGGFEFRPLHSLELNQAVLDLAQGRLTAGTHVISSTFRAHAQVSLPRVELAQNPGQALLQALTARIQLDTPFDDLSAVEPYLPGLHVRGAATLSAALQIAEGKLLAGSALDLSVPAAEGHLGVVQFNAHAHATLSVSEQTQLPTVLATANGTVTLSLPEQEPLGMQLSDLRAEGVWANNELTSAGDARIHVSLGELRLADSGPVTRAASRLVPVIAPLILGNGPLIATATAHLTPEYTLVRLKHAQLGDAQLEGAAIPGANGWNGVAAGRFGTVPVGILLRNDRLSAELFTPKTWLETEYQKAGIKPE